MSFSERGKFAAVLLFFQVVFIIIFAVLTDYSPSANAKYPANSRDMNKNGSDPDNNELNAYYPMFQDVHVMMFIGFGFLMTFLKRYGFSAVGLNMLIAAFVIQWSILCKGFLQLQHHPTIEINILSMLNADFAAAAVLITFGALLGKTSPLQMILIAFIEIIFFAINEYVGVELLKVVDVGGSMFVHVFGAYFGLACARVLYTDDVHQSKSEGSVYHSDIFAMIGTVFLWMFWPSFNSALAPGDDKHRAVINTYIALAACCVVTFAISALVDKRGKFDMVHVQNATLAGGVAVGTSADLMIHPYGAAIIGSVAAVLSVMGYAFIAPFLLKKIKLHDTCGVNNLHGMPGLLAGVTGAIVAALANVNTYGYSLYQTFGARAPVANSTELAQIRAVFTAVEAGDGRSATLQAGYQLMALGISFAVALISGALTGFLMKLSIFDQPKDSERRATFDDTLWWGVPDDFSDPEYEQKEALMDGEEKRGEEMEEKV